VTITKKKGREGGHQEGGKKRGEQKKKKKNKKTIDKPVKVWYTKAKKRQRSCTKP
jgi:hypothetical protein